ncbi:DNA polymerase theta-like isoform X2 [Octopus sinensis]|uniref:DNA polymerase theta n=1 Tax=Octopus sinensis TaxID=2607531 RepID=A0A7E6FM27_9MOLL|nr:DNA polymerase theta-like isoform X2 [Octopus sinensis]
MSVSKTGQTGQRFLGRFAVSSTCRSLHRKTSRIPKTHRKQKRKSMENSQRNDSKSGKLIHEFSNVKRSSVCALPSQDICNDGPTTLTRYPLSTEKICQVQDEDSPLKNPNEGSFISLQKLEEYQNTTNVGNSKLLLSSWNLPQPILQQYHILGIREMFQWQAECLSTGQTLNGGNLVFSAPTSAGKTMVAELLIFKRVLETKKKAIMILPFVSVAHEKVQYFKFLCDEVGIRVGGFLGSQTPRGGFKNVDIAVCTIEKGNSLVNRLLEDKQLDQLGVIVVDELHMIGDSHRGYLLELMLTKILFVSKQNNFNKSNRIKDAPNKNVQVQIIGMSATLPNLHVIAKWLDASLYTTNFRPVPLTECIKIGQTIFNSAMVKLHELNINTKLKEDADHIVSLCLETVSCGHSVLIFCPTKLWCEKLADNIAREFYHILRQKTVDQEEATTSLLPIDKEATHDIKVQLERSPAGLDFVLGKTVQCGVAFHHAGLTFDEREIIESAFRVGILKVLVATSTLSSGVNLPARRVIIRSLLFYGQVIDARTYKQMVGRAGRKGVDTKGESILICKVNEKARAYELLNAALPPIKSSFMKCLQDGPTTSLKRAILEIIVSGAAISVSDVSLYSACTLLSASVEDEERRENNVSLVSECIDFLKENEFISARNITKEDSDGAETIESCFFPTKLGSAVLASALSPDEGLHVFTELQRARRCFVLESELHILYLVTPIYNQDIAANLDWYNYYCLWEKLGPGQRRVAELVGVEEGFIAKAIRGYIPVKTSKQLRTLNIHKRFYTCLCLNDLVQEMPLSEVAKKYTCNKGQLQSLQQSAATFAGMVTVFCARLGWTMLEVLLSQFHSRLTFGIQPELCDLVCISLLNGQQARLLFSAGYTSIADLATADAIQLEFVLHTGTQFQSNKQTEDETEWEALKRLRKSRCIWLHGCQGMTAQEAALRIIKEAKHIIEDGLGGVELKWTESASVPQVSGLAQTITQSRNEPNACNLEMNSNSNLSENPHLTNFGNHLVDGNSQSVTNLSVSNSHSGADFSALTINSSTNILGKIILDLQEKQCSENLNSSQEFIQNNTTENHVLSTTYKSTISKPEVHSNARTIFPVNSNDISEPDSTKNKDKVFSNVDDMGRDRNHQLNSETKLLLLRSSSSKKNKTENLEKFSQNITEVHENVCEQLLTPNGGEFHDQLKTLSRESHVESSGKSNQNNPENSTDVDFCADISNLDIFGDSFELDTQMLQIAEKNVNEQKQKMISNQETSPLLFAEDKHPETKVRVQGDECVHFGKQSLLMSENAKEIFENSCFTVQDKEKSPNLEIFQISNSTFGVSHEPSLLLPASCHERIAYDENLSFHNSSVEENDLFQSFEENEAKKACSFDGNRSAKDYETNKYINQSNEDLFTPLPIDIFENQNCSDKTEDVFGESLTATLIEKLLPAETKNAFGKNHHSEIIKVNGINNNAPANALESQKNVTSRPCRRNLDESMISIKKRKRNSSNSETSFSEEKSEEVNLMNYDNSNNDFSPSTPPDLFSLSLDLSSVSTPTLFRSKDSKTMELSSSSVLNKTNNNNETTGQVYSTTNSSAAKSLHSKKTINAGCHSNTVLTTTDQFTKCLKKSNMNSDCLKPMEVDGIENLEEVLDIDQQANNKVVPLCDASQPCSQAEFTIIDVCSSHSLFDTFIAEWLTKQKYALSIGCENLPQDADTGIGANFMQGVPLKHLNDKDTLKFEGSLVAGFAVCWNKHDAYYVALTKDNSIDEPDDTLAPPPIDTTISIDERLQALRKIFTAHSHSDIKIVAFDAKATYRAVTTTTSVAPRYTFMDPKIASWLLDPGAKEYNFHQLIFSYLPSVQHILDDIGGNHGHGSLGLTPTNASPGRRRCTTEAVLIWHLMKHLEETLTEEQLYEPFINVEMPLINTISRMELNGFGFSTEESEVQKNIMQAKISTLEEEAYSLSGHPFSLSSTDDISKVLYLELQLPVNGNPNAAVPKVPYKTLGPKRRLAGFKSHFSTSKQILEKLKVYHRLPSVILEWRQITNSLTKVVFPLLKAKVHLAKMNMYRIFSICQLHTATGRISMFDPNLQNIPKDFQIDLPDVIKETPVTVPDARKSKHRHCKRQTKSNCGQSFAVSMRNAFVPFEGGILVAADYSQLELRIIAHLSKDMKLTNILNRDCDVFKLITSEWKNIPVEQVTDKQRQQAKQICYGMIYGIGAKALGDALNVEENDATVFMETFKSKYPGMKSYIQNTVKQCRQDGYVKTITGRKRYLPNINSSNSYSKLQAERQAVNTTVQGSAADLMKIAMINIDNELIKTFPASSQPHTVDNMIEHAKNGDILLKCRRSPRNRRPCSFLNQPSGAYLLLQIHDELIYEVGLYDLRRAATIIQTQMESAMKLSVRLPVKLKSGPSWGKLDEYTL